MSGVLVNTVAVIIGSLFGVLFKKGISKRITDSIMTGIGLCVAFIGISGAMKGKSTLIMIVSMVLGAAVGTLIDIDGKLNKLGKLAEKKFSKDDSSSFAQGFVTGSLLFCIGSMAIVGSLDAGLRNDNRMLYTKSLIDCISAAMLSTTLGFGVAFSSVIVFLLQGGVVLLAGALQSVLTDAAIAEMTGVGSLLILALGLNLTGITDIKVANYMPAIIFAPLLSLAASLLPFSI